MTDPKIDNKKDEDKEECVIKDEAVLVGKNKNKLLISFFGPIFWDLFLQKIFRNFASVKYQWLLFLYVPVVYGMFKGQWVGTGENLHWVAKIPPVTGLAFLGGGFVTLAISRMIARTSLVKDEDESACFDTDKNPKPSLQSVTPPGSAPPAEKKPDSMLLSDDELK